MTILRWLAELEDGPGDNYWVVEKLVERHSQKKLMKMITSDDKELGEAHFEDQWWIGAKSYVGPMESKFSN